MKLRKKAYEVEAVEITEVNVDAWGYQGATGPKLVYDDQGRVLDCRSHPQWERFGVVPFVRVGASGELVPASVGDYRVTVPGGTVRVMTLLELESGYEVVPFGHRSRGSPMASPGPELPPSVRYGTWPLPPVDIIARTAHEVNRAYCYSIHDLSQVPWEDAPEWQRESCRKGALGVLDGTIQFPGDSHAAWLEHKRAEGWVYGRAKDPEAKTHPCMVPFEQLPEDQQVKDHLFVAVCRALKDELVWLSGTPEKINGDELPEAPVATQEYGTVAPGVQVSS